MSLTVQSCLYKVASFLGLYKSPKWFTRIILVLYTVYPAVSLYGRFKLTYVYTTNITDGVLDGLDYIALTLANIASISSLGLTHSTSLPGLQDVIKGFDGKLKSKQSNQQLVLFTMNLFISIVYYWVFWGFSIGTITTWPYNFYVLQLVHVYVAAMIVYNTAGELLGRFQHLNSSVHILSSKIVNEVHKRLLLVCVEFNRVFGVTILFLAGSLFFGLLHPVNSALLQMMKGNVVSAFDLPHFGLHYLLISCLLMNNSMILCIPLALRCNLLEKESNRTPRLLKQLNAFRKVGVLDDLTFGGTRNYPQITAVRFFSVNRAMLFALLGGLGSYIIILIQINITI